MAAENELYFNDPEVDEGERVTVNVSTSGHVSTVDLVLSFDSDYLEYAAWFGGFGHTELTLTESNVRITDHTDEPEGKPFSFSLIFKTLRSGTAWVLPVSLAAEGPDGTAAEVEYETHSAEVTVRSTSTENRLSSVSIKNGRLYPAFSPDIFNYTVELSKPMEQLVVSVETVDRAAVWKAEGADDLRPGENTLTLTVTAGTGAERQYDFLILCPEPETSPVPAMPEPEKTAVPEAITIPDKAAADEFAATDKPQDPEHVYDEVAAAVQIARLEEQVASLRKQCLALGITSALLLAALASIGTLRYLKRKDDNG